MGVRKTTEERSETGKTIRAAITNVTHLPRMKTDFISSDYRASSTTLITPLLPKHLLLNLASIHPFSSAYLYHGRRAEGWSVSKVPYGYSWGTGRQSVYYLIILLIVLVI